MKTSAEMWDDIQYLREREARKRKWARRRAEETALKISIVLIAMCGAMIGAVCVLVSVLITDMAKEVPEPIVPQAISIETKDDVKIINTVETTTVVTQVVTSPYYIYSVDDQTRDLLERIIAAEGASHWGYSDYLSLATVIINRYNSEDFPSDFYEILSEDLQFETYSNNRYQTVSVSDECKRAVEDALQGKVNLNNEVMWFCTKDYYDTCGPDDFFKTLEHVYTCRNTYFFTE